MTKQRSVCIQWYVYTVISTLFQCALI